MPKKQLLKSAQREIHIQEAITALLNKEFSSIRGATRHFKVSFTTLTRCHGYKPYKGSIPMTLIGYWL